MAAANLTAARLRERFHYSEETGVFLNTSIVRGRRTKSGLPGSVDSHGYLRLFVDGRRHLAHRLAWLYVHGEWPSDQIDHINCIKADNSIANLRVVTQAVNQQNKRVAGPSNKLGLLGVHKTRVNTFRAMLTLNGKPVPIGCFATAIEAHNAYLEAKRRLHVGCTI